MARTIYAPAATITLLYCSFSELMSVTATCGFGIAATLSKTFFRWKSPIFIRIENNLHFDWRQASPINRLIGPLLSRWAARRSHVIAVSQTLAQATANYLSRIRSIFCR